MTMPRIERELCTGCGACVLVCPNGALSLVVDKVNLDRSRCGGCGACVDACPNGALIPVELPARSLETASPQPSSVKRPEPSTITVSVPPALQAQAEPRPSSGWVSPSSERAGTSILGRLASSLVPLARDVFVELANGWLSTLTKSSDAPRAVGPMSRRSQNAGSGQRLRRRQRRGRGW